MSIIAHVNVATATDKSCPDAFILEAMTTWLAVQLDAGTGRDIQIANRLEDCGIGHVRHDQGKYFFSMGGEAVSAPSLRGALRAWIDQRNTRELSDA